MKQRDDKTDVTVGRNTVWGFLVIGILVLLAGIFIHTPTENVSLPKAEILSGAGLIIGAVAALVITA
jgi:hypothetical protein